MNSVNTLDNLIEQGKITIIPKEVYYKYVKMGLEKFINQFDMTFEGKIDANLIFPVSGPFIIDIYPSNNHSYIHFVRTKKEVNEEKIICSYNNCTQISLKSIIYQIRYLL